MVTHCFYWFNLEYGYLTYTVLHLAARVTLIFSLYFEIQQSLLTPGTWIKNVDVYENIIGWQLTAASISGIAIAGIIKNCSILIYPHIVIKITEFICLTISMFVLSFVLSAAFLGLLVLIIGVYVYDLICLISLYRKFKMNETEAQIFHDIRNEALC